MSTITIGTGTSTGYIAPYNNYYKYATTEMIYTASEIGGKGSITAIAFNVSASSSFACTSINIYMAHTSSATFSSTSDYIPYANMTLVYSADSPTIGAATGWETVTLDTAFAYNGTDNLAIIVCRKSSSYTNALKYYYTATTGGVLYRRNDSTEAYADASSTSYSFTASDNRPNIQITLTPLTIGTGTSGSAYVPYNNANKYSTDQIVYPASSIGTAGKISRIAFNVKAADSQTRTVTIYMAHKADSTFSSTSDYVAYAEMTKVFSGSLTIGAATGWEEVTLDTAFAYNGTDNLVVIVCGSSSSTTTTLTYYCTSVTSSTLRRGGTSSAYADPSSTTYSYSSSAYRPNIQLLIAPTATVTVPSAPTNFKQTSSTSTSVTLSWSAVSGATGYKIYRDGTLLTTQTGTTYTATISPFTSYTFGVSAYNSAGESSKTTLTVYITVAPTAPTNLTVTATDYTSVSLSWSASSYADGYRIYRDGTLIATQTGTTYTDTGALPDSTYTYKVEAYSDYGTASASVSASTPFAYYFAGLEFKNAVFSINPAGINDKTVLTVTVEDVVRILEPLPFYAGEIYAGEGS
jgi:chitodextrinase